jgi:hypothetical protein
MFLPNLPKTINNITGIGVTVNGMSRTDLERAMISCKEQQGMLEARIHEYRVMIDMIDDHETELLNSQ